MVAIVRTTEPFPKRRHEQPPGTRGSCVATIRTELTATSEGSRWPPRGIGAAMTITVGTLVVILLIVLIIYFLRRA
jgi:hypothetical protein